jgi:hypothetical protein
MNSKMIIKYDDNIYISFELTKDRIFYKNRDNTYYVVMMDGTIYDIPSMKVLNMSFIIQCLAYKSFKMIKHLSYYENFSNFLDNYDDRCQILTLLLQYSAVLYNLKPAQYDDNDVSDFIMDCVIEIINVKKFNIFDVICHLLVLLYFSIEYDLTSHVYMYSIYIVEYPILNHLFPKPFYLINRLINLAENGYFKNSLFKNLLIYEYYHIDDEELLPYQNTHHFNFYVSLTNESNIIDQLTCFQDSNSYIISFN